MKDLYRPLWIILAVTIPQGVLAATFAGAFAVVGALLKEENLAMWRVFGCTLALLCAAFTALAVWTAAERRRLPMFLGPLLLAAYIPYLYLVALRMGKIVPTIIPAWMLPREDLMFAVFTFIMPALIYGLFLTVAWLTPDRKGRRLWTSTAAAVAIPAGWYALFAALSTFYPESKQIKDAETRKTQIYRLIAKIPEVKRVFDEEKNIAIVEVGIAMEE